MTLMNIYCDESTHLERDRMPFLVLGALQCPAHRVKAVSRHIRRIKEKYHIPLHEELKWVKVSLTNAEMYGEIVDYFLTSDDLQFRSVIAVKDALDHDRFGQTHDEWYYKMCFQLVDTLTRRYDSSALYFDYKDIYGGRRIAKLREFLENTAKIRRMQIVESSDVTLIQLADVLIGAVNYRARMSFGREQLTNNGKLQIVDRMERFLERRIDQGTSREEKKFNVFRWTPQVISA